VSVNPIDLLVVGAVIIFAWSGWRQGFVAALASFVGFIGGGLLGAFLAPLVLRQFGLGGASGLAATVALVLTLAVIGQIGSSYLGRELRDRITWEPAKALDNVGGAILNVLALAVIGWILASTAIAVPGSPVAEQVRESKLLAALDTIVPDQARDLVASLRGIVDTSGLPQLFDSFGVLPPAPVDPPSSAVARDPQVRAALSSVVRIEGSAPSCGAGFTGSGFIVGNNRVLTNAHVVAGVPSPRVHVPNTSDVYMATTVYFDPRVDVAILEVPGLKSATLKMAGPVARGQDAIIAGYPAGGPMTATAARVRGTISSDLARGTDIYGKPGVAREIYALRGMARPGNSGGPLLLPNGQVAGVVFAQAQADPQMAYALTAAQVAPAIAAGKALDTAVSTGPCSRG